MKASILPFDLSRPRAEPSSVSLVVTGNNATAQTHRHKAILDAGLQGICFVLLGPLAVRAAFNVLGIVRASTERRVQGSIVTNTPLDNNEHRTTGELLDSMCCRVDHQHVSEPTSSWRSRDRACWANSCQPAWHVAKAVVDSGPSHATAHQYHNVPRCSLYVPWILIYCAVPSQYAHRHASVALRMQVQCRTAGRRSMQEQRCYSGNQSGHSGPGSVWDRAEQLRRSDRLVTHAITAIVATHNRCTKHTDLDPTCA